MIKYNLRDAAELMVRRELDVSMDAVAYPIYVGLPFIIRQLCKNHARRSINGVTREDKHKHN